MRFAGNFNPEWGYLAPAPSFMRTARIVVVATAIGATAGAAVVLSLAQSPVPGALADTGKALVVVHSLVQPAEAATPVAATAPVQASAPIIAAVPARVPAMPLAKTNTPPSVQAAAPARGPQPSVQASVAPARVMPPVSAAGAPAASESVSMSTPAAPASVAALAESPPVIENSPALASDDVNAAPDQTAAQKNAKKHRANDRGVPLANAAGPNKKPAGNEHGLGPLLRHLFSARAGNSFPN
jgi:hypothetical protein